jgi:hypothetical protein
MSVCVSVRFILIAESAQVETNDMTFSYSCMMLIQQWKLVISRV